MQVNTSVITMYHSFGPGVINVIVKRYIEQVGSDEKVTCQRDSLIYRFEELDPTVIPQF